MCLTLGRGTLPNQATDSGPKETPEATSTAASSSDGVAVKDMDPEAQHGMNTAISALDDILGCMQDVQQMLDGGKRKNCSPKPDLQRSNGSSHSVPKVNDNTRPKLAFTLECEPTPTPMSMLPPTLTLNLPLPRSILHMVYSARSKKLHSFLIRRPRMSNTWMMDHWAFNRLCL